MIAVKRRGIMEAGLIKESDVERVRNGQNSLLSKACLQRHNHAPTHIDYVVTYGRRALG